MKPRGRASARALDLLLRPPALAALSGLLLALSFPKFGHGAVAWVALAPLFVALAQTGGGRPALRLGYITGAVSSLGIVYWTALVVVQFGGLGIPAGIGAMALLCLALAAFPSLAAWAVGTWVRAFGKVAILAAPLAWVAVELVRARTAGNFAWCLLGYSQYANLPMIQVARFTAVYGVSLLVAGVSAVVAYAAIERRPRPRRTAVAVMAALVALVWVDGVLRLRRPEAPAPTLRVGLVQASIAQPDKWDPEKAWENVDHHSALTLQAAAEGARLVVWPESAVPFYFDHSPEAALALRDLVRENDVYLFFGNDDRERGTAERRVWVGAKLLGPGGEIVYRYHKVRLVPFGEYVPLQPLLTVGGRYTAKLVRQVSDFTPGEDFSVGAVDGNLIGAFICYEAIFPDLVRQFTTRGARLLVNVTNDGWYGRTSAPYQHLAMALFRAVENGRYLVRAANTGITAVVDTRGRIVERTQLFDRTVLVRDVPLAEGSTFYARRGDVLAWLCVTLSLSLTAAAIVVGRKS
ncbi:MAG TPA: apolipoprotein N-acyltransferase [Vicinamibacteria bacterium]|nr:apolipoprotein N-acyltransferase [Vicinamibacteria bacterium]